LGDGTGVDWAVVELFGAGLFVLLQAAKTNNADAIAAISSIRVKSWCDIVSGILRQRIEV
jgi:hypothetical protein